MDLVKFAKIHAKIAISTVLVICLDEYFVTQILNTFNGSGHHYYRNPLYGNTPEYTRITSSFTERRAPISVFSGEERLLMVRRLDQGKPVVGVGGFLKLPSVTTELLYLPPL